MSAKSFKDLDKPDTTAHFQIAAFAAKCVAPRSGTLLPLATDNDL
jgi:hypothetical protein